MYFLLYSVFKILIIIIPLILFVAYLTYWERKMIGAIQLRIGPNKVGFKGLLQPFADVFKLLTKEIITPLRSNKILFFIAPITNLMPSLSSWAIIPFDKNIVLSDINAGILYFISITSLGIYGIIIAGWSSNSKYAFLGSMRAAAQMMSYELTISFIMISILLVSNSMNISTIINNQEKGFFFNYGLNFMSWNWISLLPLFIIYIISSVAETNRHPFDVVEGESEIVAGHMVEYSGIGFALFFLSEYSNIILLSSMASIMFLGGWISPINNYLFNIIPGFIWFFIKTFLVSSLFIWFRSAFPRYRYDQIMHLGWKIFIPLTGIYMLLISLLIQTPYNIWCN